MNKGIIYLVQPTELIGTKRYKIGCSKNTELDRVKNGYKKGSRHIIIMETQNPLVLEKKIKKIFNEKFKLIAGCEYFEGDEENMKEYFLKIKIEHDKQNKIDTSVSKIFKNNYENDKIISRNILINKNKISEYSNFYEKLEYVFQEITDFYRQNISMIDKEDFNLQINKIYNEINKKYDDIIIEINNNLSKSCINNEIITYITKYKNIIINIINNNFYDDNVKWGNNLCCSSYDKSLCYFLGTYNENYSFLTLEYIKNMIKIFKEYRYYEIIKETKNKYSGIIQYKSGKLEFISNIDLDYNYWSDDEIYFYKNCKEYINDNHIIKEHLEGHLDNYDFKHNFSIFSLYKSEGEFEKIVYPEIIKLSITENFSQKLIILIQNNKNILDKFKDKKNIKILKKYKNLQSFIKNNLLI
jgi:hypothetical protein